MKKLLLCMLSLSLFTTGFAATTYTPPEFITCQLINDGKQISPILSCDPQDVDHRLVIENGYTSSKVPYNTKIKLRFVSAGVEKGISPSEVRVLFNYKSTNPLQSLNVTLASTYKWITPDLSNSHWQKSVGKIIYNCTQYSCPMTQLPFTDDNAHKGN